MPQTLRSPNEMFEAGKRIMLNGREPETPKDWMKLVNFFAYNIADGLELPATKILAKVLGAPLGEDTIEKIVNSQIKLKYKERMEKARRN